MSEQILNVATYGENIETTTLRSISEGIADALTVRVTKAAEKQPKAKKQHACKQAGCTAVFPTAKELVIHLAEVHNFNAKTGKKAHAEPQPEISAEQVEKREVELTSEPITTEGDTQVAAPEPTPAQPEPVAQAFTGAMASDIFSDIADLLEEMENTDIRLRKQAAHKFSIEILIPLRKELTALRTQQEWLAKALPSLRALAAKLPEFQPKLDEALTKVDYANQYIKDLQGRYKTALDDPRYADVKAFALEQQEAKAEPKAVVPAARPAGNLYKAFADNKLTVRVKKGTAQVEKPAFRALQDWAYARLKTQAEDEKTDEQVRASVASKLSDLMIQCGMTENLTWEGQMIDKALELAKLSLASSANGKTL